MQTDNENQSILNEGVPIEGSLHQLDEQELDTVTGGQIGRPANVSSPSSVSSPEASPPLSPVRHELRLRPRPIQRTTSAPDVLFRSGQVARLDEQADTIRSRSADRLTRSRSLGSLERS